MIKSIEIQLNDTVSSALSINYAEPKDKDTAIADAKRYVFTETSQRVDRIALCEHTSNTYAFFRRLDIIAWVTFKSA